MWAFDGIRTARTLRAAAIPNGDGLPHWPRCDKDAQLIYLDKTVASGPDAARAEFEFLSRK
jgi:hypothetical protein